jgi:hypothetical protein
MMMLEKENNELNQLINENEQLKIRNQDFEDLIIVQSETVELMTEKIIELIRIINGVENK